MKAGGHIICRKLMTASGEDTLEVTLVNKTKRIRHKNRNKTETKEVEMATAVQGGGSL